MNGVELPDWASVETRQSLARDQAVYIGRILLADDGAAGWDWSVNARLRAHEQPLVRDIAATLPRGRMWTPHRVAQAVCAALDLHGAAYDIAERLRDTKARIGESAKLTQPGPDYSDIRAA